MFFCWKNRFHCTDTSCHITDQWKCRQMCPRCYVVTKLELSKKGLPVSQTCMSQDDVLEVKGSMTITLDVLKENFFTLISETLQRIYFHIGLTSSCRLVSICKAIWCLQLGLQSSWLTLATQNMRLMRVVKELMTVVISACFATQRKL